MAKEMRRATIGFSVKGDLKSLERANKLLDEMPKKATKVTGMLEKAFSNEGLKNVDKLGKAYSELADKSQDAVDKIVKQNKRASQSTEENVNKSAKTVDAFSKKLSAIDSIKSVEIKTKYNNSVTAQAQRAVDKLGHTSPVVKVKTNTKQETQRATEAVEKFSGNAKRYFRNAGESAGQFMGSGLQKAKNKLHELDQQAGSSEHLFSKIFSSTLISNAILSSWSALTGKIKEAAKAGLDYEKGQDQMLATWTTLGGSKKVARRMRKSINNYSTETGQDTDLVNEEEQGFYHLHSNEKESNSMTHAMLNMTDAVGLSKDQAKSVSQDMVHTLAGGVVQTGDLNVIGQYFPMFNEAMEKYLAKVKHVKSISGKDLREMAKTGKISASAYEKVFEQLGNVKYGAAAERMMGTFNGMERTIKSRVPALMGMMEKPFLTQESGLYRGISKWVAAKKTEKEFEKLGKAINTSVNTIAKAFSSTFHLGSSSKVMDRLMSGLTKGVVDFGGSIKRHMPDIKVFFEAMKATSGASLKVMVQSLKDLLPILKVVGDFVSKHPKVFGTWAAGMILMSGATKVLHGSLVGLVGAGKILKAPLSALNGLGRAFQRIKLGPKAKIDEKPFNTSVGKFFKSAGSKIGTGWSKLKGAMSSKEVGGLAYKEKGGWINNLTSRHVSNMSAAGKVATGAVGVGIAVSSGLDIYKGIKAKNPKKKFEDFGSGIGTALGGGIGFFFGGPAGAAIGASIGKFIGKWGGKGAKQFTDGWNKKGRGAKKPPKGLLPKAGYYAREAGDAVTGWYKSAKKGFTKYGPKVVHFITHPFSDSTKWFLTDTKTGKRISKWATGVIKKVKSIKIPNPFKNFHPIKWFESKLKNFHPIKWIKAKLTDLGKIKIANPFDKFHPIKWFESKIAGFHPIKDFKNLISGFTKISIPNPFKNFHPIKWFKDTLSGFHPVKMIKDAFSGGSKAVKKVISAVGFATGTKGRYPNGLPHDMMAKVNDGGSRELILPPEQQPFMFRKMNQIAFLRKGTHVLNGRDSKRATGMAHLASGTAQLPKIGGVATKVKTGIDGTKKKYDKELNGSKKSISSFKRSSKSDFAKVKSDTTSKIGTMSSKVQKAYKSMSGGVNGTAKDLSSSLSHKTGSMSSNLTHKVKNMGSNLDDITGSISKQWRKTWSNMVNYFGNVMTKLKPYAHKGMSGAVSALNGGISSIDSALGQFGGNKSVLKPIHYATGSNGPIGSDQLAVLNDAVSGPRQELVLRNNQLLKPEGNDTLTHLKKGDHVLNGHQAKRFLPHYAKGTGLSDNALIDLATKNSGNPKGAFKSGFDKHIGKGGSSVLSKGILKTAKGAVDSLGTAWSSAMWGLINSTIQGGGTGNGSLKPHFGGKFTESSGYGRRTSDVSDFHKGIDFAAPMGTPIPAQYAGTVVTAGSASGFGNWVVIRPNGQDINTIYGHMRSYSVHAGQHVKAGQIIARVGAEGEATGPHVHYELRKGLGSGDSRPNPDTYKGKVKKLPKGGKGLNGLVKRELGSKALNWIEDHLQSDVSSISMSGDVAERARSLAKAIKRLYPSATNAGIAAVLGNWSFESGLNPNAINPGGGASGLGQWLGGRKTALINYGSKHGKSWKNAGTQLAFALNGDGSDSSLLKSILRGSGSVASLATRFSTGWERGGYTSQHVAGARKIEAALHNAGGWSVPGKLNIFGEKDQEVAINPKMASADGLIASAIDKRSKVNGSGIAGQLKRAAANQESITKRQSLYKQAITGLRSVVTSTHRSSNSGNGSKIVISPTFNFNGNTDAKTAHDFANYTLAQLKKLVQQEIQRHERATYAVTSEG
ncbi:phage tail tip lysozyme [Lactiplantibacillus paraxiangfangensis]|uniref:phage tail tip lysozyme n=1 Tax=Lactiplantibacillus paraxiangfangensis TaxID=3076224 RepID=UPI0030C72763